MKTLFLTNFSRNYIESNLIKLVFFSNVPIDNVILLGKKRPLKQHCKWVRDHIITLTVLVL